MVSKRYMLGMLGVLVLLTCFMAGAVGQETTQVCIDGYAEDWAGRPVLLADPAGDNKGGAFDIASISGFTNNLFLYLLIRTTGERGPYVQIDLDIGADARHFIASFGPDVGSRANLGEIRGNAFVHVGEVEGSLGAVAEVVELKISLVALGNPTSVRLRSVRPMAGTCCEDQAWYAIDSTAPVSVPRANEIEPEAPFAIRGRVTAAAVGTPIAGATIELIDATRTLQGDDGQQWPRVAWLRTDDSGEYSFASVPTSDYWVIAYADGYAREVYEGQVSIHEAPVVSYTGTPISGIDFVLNEAGTISGRVTLAGGTTPVPDTIVVATEARYAWLSNRWYMATSAADGTYRIGNLPLGEYMVTVWWGKGYVAEYYNDVHYLDQFSPVRVAPLQDTPGIDFPLDPEGRISGSVIDDVTGAPIEGAFIHASPQQGEEVIGSTTGLGAFTDADGAFSVGTLPAAGFLLSARADGYADEIYQHRLDWSEADLIWVESGQHVTGLTIRMRVGRTLAGHLYDGVTREPLRGFMVSILVPDGGNAGAMPTRPTVADGSYSICLPAGTYIARAQVPGYVPEYYQDAFRSRDATPLVVTTGSDVTGVDFYLRPAGAISGHIYRSDGKTPVPYAQVYASPLDAPIGGGAVAGADGSFRIVNLPSGRYRIQVTVPGSPTTVYYPGTLLESAAQAVSVSAPAETSGIAIVVP